MSRMPLEPDAVKRGGHSHPVLGVLCTVLLILAILIVAAVFAIQTRGGCDLLSDYLRERTGLNLAIGGARFALPYDLVLENVRTREEGGAGGSFTSREVRLEWRPGIVPILKIRGAQLGLVAAESGVWSPASLEPLAEVRDVRQTAALLGGLPNVILDVRDSAISWTERGTNTAAIEGVTLCVTPVRLPGRLWRLFELQAARVVRAGGGTGRSVHRTWISTEENGYLELLYRGLWDEAPPAAPDWWSVPEPLKPANGVPP